MPASKQNDRKQRLNCRHCGRLRTGNRPRGLCWTCYYTPSVRNYYPADPKSGNGARDSTRPSTLPGKLLLLRPGSEEKIALMERRASKGEALFHPDEYEMLKRRALEGLPPFPQDN